MRGFHQRRTENMIKELKEMKDTNSQLQQSVAELQLEIQFHRGETRRLASEKNLLLKDMRRMAEFVKHWAATCAADSGTATSIDVPTSTSSQSIPLEALSSGCAPSRYPSAANSIFSSAEQLLTLPVGKVNKSLQSIDDVLQVHHEQVMLLTSSQMPHFIEYANSAWCARCGWLAREVLGYTCAMLQGKDTDVGVAAEFMESLKRRGCANMSIVNYDKNNRRFRVDVEVHSIFDTTAVDSPMPVITHFASVMSNFSYETTDSFDGDESTATTSSSSGSCALTDDAQMLSSVARIDAPVPFVTQNNSVLPCDRRSRSKYYPIKATIAEEVFIQSGSLLRLSNLLRLMLSSSDAMVLTDGIGRIVHINEAWAMTTGYDLSAVQGLTCKILQGAATDDTVIQQANLMLKKLKCASAATRRSDDTMSERVIIAPREAHSRETKEQRCHSSAQYVHMSVINYRKDGSSFLNHVIIVPIRGGYMSSEVTHYCALLKPEALEGAPETEACGLPAMVGAYSDESSVDFSHRLGNRDDEQQCSGMKRSFDDTISPSDT